jgi:flagellar biosynthetic protein FliP
MKAALGAMKAAATGTATRAGMKESKRPRCAAPGRKWPRALFIACVLMLAAAPALAQEAAPRALSDLLQNPGGLVTGRMIQLIVLLTVLSLAPGLLIMVTSFTRIIVALAFLRAGLGLQTTPANLIVISLALFMTFFVMQPTLEKAWTEGVRPLMDERITEEEAFRRIIEPFRAFMLDHVREKDLALFRDLAERAAAPRDNAAAQATPPAAGEAPEAVPLRVLIPAFMVSELRRGFEIGFLLMLPFLVIDLIVATIVMSMGMMMLPPTIISLPFKILFFVLIDGWNLLAGGLVRSFY